MRKVITFLVMLAAVNNQGWADIAPEFLLPRAREELNSNFIADINALEEQYPNDATRKGVAVSFGKVKNQKALGVLEKVRVEDSDKEVREAADRAINRIKE